MFAANKTGRDLLIEIAQGIAPTGVSPPKKVYHYADVAERQTQFPNIEVTPPVGDIECEAADDIRSVLRYWVIATVSSASPDETDTACEAYLTALVNAYAFREGYVGSAPYRLTVTTADTSPPFVDNAGKQLRSVAVQVVVEFHE